MLATRQALRAEGAFELLHMVSALLAVTDPRSQNPFERARGKRMAGPTPEELVATFADVDFRETTALLAVIAAMVDDEVVARRARRAVESRRHSLPGWLVELTPIEVGRVVEMTHVLGDGDNIIIDLRTGYGEQMTVMVYIDHNMGTLIKDAFVVPGPTSAVLGLYEREAHEDTVVSDLDPADARARITRAGEMSVITYPPPESDTWPACRSLVEWAVRQMPEGGRGYVRPTWNEQDRRSLADRFFSSPYADSLDEEDRSLLDSFLWFACDYGPGDPLRWSSVAVEILLADWLPRKVVADAEYLARAPELLRAFVRFCHGERNIRRALTEETLSGIDRWTPVLLERIGEGPHPLLGFPYGLLDPDLLPSYEEMILESLAGDVGGEEALAALDADPLPDEEFEWAGIAADVRAEVGAVGELCDVYCDAHLDAEYRTACRRLLARIARGDPRVFRRGARPETAAAALCWVIGKANRLFRGSVYAKDMLAWFGVRGSASQRAATLLRAAGLDGHRFGYHSSLGTPDLLVSSRRAGIIDSRDRYTTTPE